MAPYSGSPIVDKDIEAGQGGMGSEKMEEPVAVLIDPQTSHEGSRRNWPAMGKTTAFSAESRAAMLQSRSQTTAPPSPSGGTSTALTMGLVGAADNEYADMPASPYPAVSPPMRPSPLPDSSDPLIRGGAIVRPPLSSSSPNDVLSAWQREQAAVRRALHAVSAAARGDKAWSSSAGQVPMPDSPTLQRSPGFPTSNDDDDGLDIFEVLLHGPMHDAKR